MLDYLDNHTYSYMNWLDGRVYTLKYFYIIYACRKSSIRLKLGARSLIVCSDADVVRKMYKFY